MSVSKGSMFSQDKSKGTQNTQTASTSTPVFDQTGQSLISRLAGAQSDPNSGVNRASDALFRLSANNEQSVNPYVEDIIRQSNVEGRDLHDSGLAQLRAGGYRGGTAQNLYQQGDFSSRFASQLAGENARLRYGAYDAGQNRALQGYGAAGATGATGQTLALQLLSLLRGETGTGTQNTQSTGKNTTIRDPEASFAI